MSGPIVGGWLYEVETGRLFCRDELASEGGYSGFGAGKNNPAMEHVKNVGPIPRGEYRMGYATDSSVHGPLCIPLEPCEGTETFGRGGFLIHGDSREHPGAASHGCIVLPHDIRHVLACSRDRILEVR